MHILMITRHYPPEISGGARRPFLYSHALKNLGHEVTVVTPFENDFQQSIVVKSRAIDRGVSQLHMSGLPKAALSLKDHLKNIVRPWIYWPDDNIQWVKQVVRKIEAMDVKPSLIFTTSPPESIHFAGVKLSKSLNIPWVAEFRDTWVSAPHRKVLEDMSLRRNIETRIARNYLKTVSGVTAVSDAVMSDVRNYMPDGVPELIISHFSDASQEDAFPFASNTLNILHTGGFTLSDRRRLIGPLLNDLDKVSQSRRELVFHIAGPLTETERDLARQAKTEVVCHDSVSLKQARAMQQSADGLILYSPDGSHALPGKYAEYILSERPIFVKGEGPWRALAPKENDIRPLVSGLKALQKNERVKYPAIFTDVHAAKALSGFFDMILADWTRMLPRG